jgi:hypothetical protein
MRAPHLLHLRQTKSSRCEHLTRRQRVQSRHQEDLAVWQLRALINDRGPVPRVGYEVPDVEVQPVDCGSEFDEVAQEGQVAGGEAAVAEPEQVVVVQDAGVAASSVSAGMCSVLRLPVLAVRAATVKVEGWRAGSAGRARAGGRRARAERGRRSRPAPPEAEPLLLYIRIRIRSLRPERGSQRGWGHPVLS